MAVLHRVDIDVKAAADAGKKAAGVFMANVKAGMKHNPAIKDIFERIGDQWGKAMKANSPLGLGNAYKTYVKLRTDVEKAKGIATSQTKADLARLNAQILANKGDQKFEQRTTEKLSAEIGKLSAEAMRLPEIEAVTKGKRDLLSTLGSLEKLSISASMSQGMGREQATDFARMMTDITAGRINKAASAEELKSIQSDLLGSERQYMRTIDMQKQKIANDKLEAQFAKAAQADARRSREQEAMQRQAAIKRELADVESKFATEKRLANEAIKANRLSESAEASFRKGLYDDEAAARRREAADRQAELKRELADVESKFATEKRLANDALKESKIHQREAQQFEKTMQSFVRTDYASAALARKQEALTRYATIEGEFRSAQAALDDLANSTKSITANQQRRAWMQSTIEEWKTQGAMIQADWNKTKLQEDRRYREQQEAERHRAINAEFASVNSAFNELKNEALPAIRTAAKLREEESRREKIVSDMSKKTFEQRQKNMLTELDNLVSEGKDRQRLKNMFDWLPWRNSLYASTPGIRASILQFIPGLRTAGKGDPYQLAENRDIIAREIQNARTAEQLDAIRRQYDFDRRHAVYQADINKYKNRSTRWAIRDAEGNYLPTVSKMQDYFGSVMRRLAAAWVGVMWTRMMLQPFAMGADFITTHADKHTRQKNMYNVSLPYGMTSGKSFEQWEDESFAKARSLRMNAAAYREMVMNAAPIFHTAVYGKDYKKGAIGADGRMHYQGERIVTDMKQVEQIAENLHRMAKISGSSDVEMHAALRQVIQMISKGRGNIQDIRPILESGGHMGDMIARFGFGAAGAADLYKLNEDKALTADKLLKNLLSDKTTDDLRELMRRTARTWEDVAAIMKGDINKLFLPTIRSFAAESEYGLGDKLLGITKSLADNTWIGEAIRDRIDLIIEDLSQRWFDYLRIGLKSLAVVGYIASGVSIIGGTLAKIFGYVTNFVGDYVTTDLIDKRLKQEGLDGRFLFESPTDHLVDLATGTGDQRLRGAILRRIGLANANFEKSENMDKLLNSISGFTDSDIDAIMGEFSNWNEDSQARSRSEIHQGIENAKKIAGTDITDLLKLNDESRNLRDTTNEMIDSLVGGVIGGSSWLLEKGLSNDPRELFGIGEGSIEAAVKQMEDERLPGHALDLANRTAGNTGETAKNTRKANQIQLAILKQVAGTRVVNRVVHVNPNIVSNVGTIRNGIEYDQLLKDLGSTVNHAVTAYAL